MDQVPGGRFLCEGPGAMRRRGAASVIAAVVLLGACASFDGRGLVPGKSIATEVEALMGPAAQRLSLPGGETALYFSRLPVGHAMYVATIGPDGILRSLEQRLTRENMAKLIPGSSTMKEVRELFGPPGLAGRLDLQPREWWEYKYLYYQDQHVLWVLFSDDGVVREMIDRRALETAGGGRGSGGGGS